jgi:hypothetical protein
VTTAPPIPTHGASDAGSGVATILEEYVPSAQQNITKNDIIILFAEELGLKRPFVTSTIGQTK